MQRKKNAFEKWLDFLNVSLKQSAMSAKKSKTTTTQIDQSERQNENLDILITEKQELEKKVEF